MGFSLFFIGFFIDGGLVLHDTLYTGKTGNAVALGPLPIPKTDNVNAQLMDLASLANLERAVIEKMKMRKQSGKTKLLEIESMSRRNGLIIPSRHW